MPRKQEANNTLPSLGAEDKRLTRVLLFCIIYPGKYCGKHRVEKEDIA